MFYLKSLTFDPKIDTSLIFNRKILQFITKHVDFSQSKDSSFNALFLKIAA